MNSNKQEIQIKDLKIDENIAYFLGVLHSDGCIYFFNDKKKNRLIIRLILQVGTKSIPMAIQFKKILLDYFGKKVNLRKIPHKNLYVIQTSINRVWHLFKHWNKYQIPGKIKNDIILFGAYLTGIIDGDGHIKIKNNKDRLIPQCMVRITSGCRLEEIKKLIEYYFNCKVHFEYYKDKKAVDTCFYVSNRNLKLITKYIYPHILLPYKKLRLKKFINMKNEPVRI